MSWLSANWRMVCDYALAHLALAVPAILCSVLVAVPIGRLAHRHPRWGKPILSAASLFYAVPALPLLVIIPALAGTRLRSNATMIIALTVYGVALLVRTAADAFAAVDRRTHDAAIAVGNSPRSVFWRVDLPLAAPVLLAGVRVVTVSTIGLASIGALVGIPSLGFLLTDGLQRRLTLEICTGIVGTVALAILLDVLLVIGGRLALPWTRKAHP